MLYFDYAAATPMSKSVLEAMQPYFADKFYNPSALYLAAQDVKRAVTSARESVAAVLQCKPSEVIFTAGGTESDNLAIRGVMEAHPGKNLVVSAVEHDAVLAPAANYGAKVASVEPDGRIDIEALEQLIDDNTVLVSIMYVNNEIGTIQPIREIATLIKEIRWQRVKSGNKLPLYLHSDAAQAANYLPVLVNTPAVDLLSLNGGKIYGPKQSGVLYVRTGTVLNPQILGGGQERGIRSGTENVAGAIGFAAALKEAADMREAEFARLALLAGDFSAKLEAARPDIIINGSRKHRVVNNVHITVPGADNERLMMELDERGIMVATGSACSASSDEPSHVLKAIGLTDEDARSSLRITFGRHTDQAAVDHLADTLLSLL